MKQRKLNRLYAQRLEAERKCKVATDALRVIADGKMTDHQWRYAAMILRRLEMTVSELVGDLDPNFDLVMEVERLRKENRQLRRERSISEMQWAYGGRHKEMFEDYSRLKSMESMNRMIGRAAMRNKGI